jgi:hypothetical protein
MSIRARASFQSDHILPLTLEDKTAFAACSQLRVGYDGDLQVLADAAVLASKMVWLNEQVNSTGGTFCRAGQTGPQI